MIVHEPEARHGACWYATCLACGWCSKPYRHEQSAAEVDDAHLAAKLAARGDRREDPPSLTPEESPGSVATSFGVPGDPYGKGRPRAARRGRGVRVFTPQETLDAEERVRGAWRHAGAVELEGPLSLELVAVHGRGPSYWLKSGGLSAYGRRMGAVPTLKPDLDNVVKLVMDALNGAAYADDAQVVHIVARRRWAAPGEPPHVHIHLAQEAE